jgi:hypothetical protein
MSGSGSWQNLLPDESSRHLYAEIYPAGAPLLQEDNRLRQLLDSWQKATIVRYDGKNVVPLGPIMMDDDLVTLNPWFQDISDSMCMAVLERLPEYQSLASSLAGNISSNKHKLENILTVQICAHTLDSWVFAQLRKKQIGKYPPRDFAGDFFFWGYAFTTGPKKIFGFTTYGGWGGPRLHMIRSHGLDRSRIIALLRRRDTWDYLQHLFSSRHTNDRVTSGGDLHQAQEGKIVDSLRHVEILERDDPPRLAIPIFTGRDMEQAITIYEAVSGKIMSHINDRKKKLEALVSQCSFAKCSWPDILCMLFHLAYSYAADKLVARGTIPEFPESAGGEWGVWVH